MVAFDKIFTFNRRLYSKLRDYGRKRSCRCYSFHNRIPQAKRFPPADRFFCGKKKKWKNLDDRPCSSICDIERTSLWLLIVGS